MVEDAPVATFACHRGVTPMLWAFAALAGIELVVVHLLLIFALPGYAWPIGLMTALAIVWLVAWIRSWERLPHGLHADHLRLYFGSLRRVDVPLAAIAAVSGEVSDAALKRHAARNLVPIAAPNRVVVLRAPLADRRRTRALAIRLDDPDAFDAALRRSGAAVRVGDVSA